MDPQETSVYQYLIVAAVVIGSILLYSMFAALRRQSAYRFAYNREIGTEIMARENERKWLAADMHDDLSPLLSATKMTLSGVGKDPKADAVRIIKCLKYLAELTAKIRTLARSLMPAVLLDKGLVTALQQFINGLSRNNNPDIVLTATALPQLSQDAAIHLFRIVQEIIHNTVKHARAGKLHIHIYVQKNRLILATADDGTGFSYQKNMQGAEGYGLTGIQSRIQLLNGNFNADTVKGTRYYIEIPLAGNTAVQLKNTPRPGC